MWTATTSTGPSVACTVARPIGIPATSSDADLQFVAQAANADGSVVGLRQKDNVHFSEAGGTRVSWAVMDRIGELVDISAGNVTPPPADAPPPGVQARSELPPPV